jgi:hypothetical protein
MAREPFVKLFFTGGGSDLTLVFEPWGSEYLLTGDDEVRVHVHGDGSRERPESSDAEMIYSDGRINLYLYDEFTAWNKAGEELKL